MVNFYRKEGRAMKEALRYIFRFLLVPAAVVGGFSLNISNHELSLMEVYFAVDSQGYIYIGDTDDMIIYKMNSRLKMERDM